MIVTITRDEYARAFSKRLRRAAVERDMTNKEIAAAADINRTAISAYLNGKTLPTAFTLAKLCVALGCDANVLLGTTGVVKR